MQAIIFDLDGTLVETAPDLHLVLSEVMQTLGLSAPPLSAVRGMIGDGARALLDRALAAAGQERTSQEIDHLYAEFIDRYTSEPCRTSHLYDGVTTALEEVRAQGAKLGVCTNKPQRPSELLLEALNISQFFDAVVGGDALDIRKPHPGHLQTTLDRMGADRCDAVMVGDSQNDLLTARALGVPCILVSFGYTSVPARELGPDRVIDGFGELCQALGEVRSSA
ncbi:phosphoglycolate phosphatase [Arboricoccus pini]|uniref:Phosphoglycolate phosphatase n=1 Tax=Arboricoccus pini TaxID=1963835 RepID=A0A212R2T4_9PROT|nr:phosphoglycolate phosphatase [Arboricoccus pini]SNB66295.1 phosphoglycolate phosphatase [Arboricoccus pini]